MHPPQRLDRSSTRLWWHARSLWHARSVVRLRAKVAAPSSLDEQRADLDAARRGVAALRDAVRARPVAAVTLAAPDSDDDLYPAGLDWVEPLLVRGEVVTNS